jgi:hypothetical protein
MNESYQKNQLSFLEAHKKAVEFELNNRHEDHVREKYEWVQNYHNNFIKDSFSNDEKYLKHLM